MNVWEQRYKRVLNDAVDKADEIDAMRAELAKQHERRFAEVEALSHELDALRTENEELHAALEAVIAEADRKTAAFERAHELLIRHKGP